MNKINSLRLPIGYDFLELGKGLWDLQTPNEYGKSNGVLQVRSYRIFYLRHLSYRLEIYLSKIIVLQ